MSGKRHRVRQLPDGRYMCNVRMCRFTTSDVSAAIAHALQVELKKVAA